jgi:hypothetical protein
MADNKTLPPTGTGTADIVVATDEIAGVDYQKIKLVDGTADSSTPAIVDANGSLHVTLLGADASPAQVSDGALLISDALMGSPQVGAQVLGTNTYTEGTSVGVTAGAVRRDADTTLVNTTNEFGPLQMDANGRLKVEAFSGETLPTSLATLPALVAGSANIGDVDVLTVPADPFGTTADAGSSGAASMNAHLRFIAATGIPVTALPNVTLAAGTGTQEVVGDVAHDAGIAGNPVTVGAVSIDTDDTAPPNRVSAEAESVRVGADRDGSIHVLPFGPQVWKYHVNGSSALTDTSVHSAPGAGLSLYIGTIVFSSGAATAINMFLEETSTTIAGPYYLEAVAGRGMAIQFNPPLKVTANTALTITTSAAIAHSVDITGFTGQG